MIFVTGDCHGDYSRFKTKAFSKQTELTKEDYVIVCGDFGYWKDTEEQNYWLDWLDNKSFTTLWVDGNHENFDKLKEIEVVNWERGKAQFIRPSIIHLLRGQVFTIDDCKIFTFGGARSHDIDGGVLDLDDPNFLKKKQVLESTMQNYRINHVSWWHEEQPSLEEMEEGFRNLEAHQNKVNYIVTHDCAAYTKVFVNQYPKDANDYLPNYLQQIKEKASFKKWYFGHHHQDKAVNDQETVIYKKIIQI